MWATANSVPQSDIGMTEIKQTIIRLSGQLSLAEIPFLRGAVMDLAHNEPAFHNHADDSSSLYRMPAIQYKLLDGAPAIVGVNCQESGADALERLFTSGSVYEFRIGRSIRSFRVESKQTLFPCLCDTPGARQRYVLSNWLPLNQENYRRYRQTDSMAERVAQLDRTLVGNLLSLYKSFDVIFKEEISACIVEILSQREALYKDVKMTTMDVVFDSDIFVPSALSIGKGASRGFGVVDTLRV